MAQELRVLKTKMPAEIGGHFLWRVKRLS